MRTAGPRIDFGRDVDLDHHQSVDAGRTRACGNCENCNGPEEWIEVARCNHQSNKRSEGLILLCHKLWYLVPSGAAWATRERRGESGHQSPSHRCNRVRNVAFRPQRRILWAGDLRVRQIAGTAWWHDLLRGEWFLARRSGIRRPQCKGWRDGGSRAIPVLQNVPARPPA